MPLRLGISLISLLWTSLIESGGTSASVKLATAPIRYSDPPSGGVLKRRSLSYSPTRPVKDESLELRAPSGQTGELESSLTGILKH
jgi:hypothetical protein